MMNNYIKRSVLMLGAAAVIGSSAMAEEGTWRNINTQLKNPALLPNWCGALSGVGNGVGEVFNAPFEIYQIIPDLPAGEYTLTVNALYRSADNYPAYETYKTDKSTTAYIFINDVKQAVANVYDHDNVSDETVRLVKDEEGNDVIDWSVYPVPNDLAAANAEFEAGKYVNTVKCNHQGGDLRIGIANTGSRYKEWTAFDNFKLVGPNGEVTVPNGDFSQGLENSDNIEIWDMKNAGGSVKTPDIAKDGNGGYGCFRKSNATEYGIGQRVELEAGTYRFGVQSFFRQANGNTSNVWVGLKGAYAINEGTSAYDLHVNGTEDTEHWPYIYVTDGWDLADDEVTIAKPFDEEGAKYGNPDAFFKKQNIKCIFDEQLDVYPDNEPSNQEGMTAEGYGWCDSGFEYQAAGVFVKHPELYRNYVEFTLPEKANVWVGMILVKRPAQACDGNNHYWHAFRDFTLEKLEGGAGVENVAADLVNANAPVEYYNLQGVRVANPENGIFIVKQGNKVSKQVIR